MSRLWAAVCVLGWPAFAAALLAWLRWDESKREQRAMNHYSIYERLRAQAAEGTPVHVTLTQANGVRTPAPTWCPLCWCWMHEQNDEPAQWPEGQKLLCRDHADDLLGMAAQAWCVPQPLAYGTYAARRRHLREVVERDLERERENWTDFLE